MMPRRSLLWPALAAASLALLSPGRQSAAQITARIVDMDGGLVLASDGRVFARSAASLDDPIRWSFVAAVPAESPPVALQHLSDAPMHFLVVTEDGDVYRYEGLNKRVERLSNVYGVITAPRVNPKTIGGEKIDGTEIR